MREIKQTHTFVTLEISESAFDEIYNKLKYAGYEHCFTQDSEDKIVIDMKGIALTDGKSIY